MKKLFALLLVMLLVLPAALAEGAPYALDLGHLTMDIYPGDVIEIYEKAENTPMLYLYPVDSGDENYMDNINLLWNSEDVSAMTQADLDALAEYVLTQSQQQYDSMGIATDNFQLLGTELEEGVMGAILYSFDIDYSSLGVDMKATIYQYQVFFMLGAEGSYIFTASSDSFEALSALSVYADSIQIK